MHMTDVDEPSPLMQVVNILRDKQQIACELGFQPAQGQMRCVWLDFGKARASFIVKTQHQIGIARKTFRRCDVIDAVSLP